MSKGSLFLIHWDQAEAESYASALRAAGWEVAYEAEDGAKAGKAIKANPPSAVVVYLDRKPSHGRAAAAYLAETKSTSTIPLIFVGGDAEAREKNKAKMPQAQYVSADELAAALAQYAK